MVAPESSVLPTRHCPSRQQSLDPQSRAAEPHFSYSNRFFWFAYLSSTLLAVANSLLFRYADFVTSLGGDEWHLGWIVGVGMVGSLAVRLSMGSYIDRYGTRVVWLGSLVLFAVTCFANLTVTSCTGVAVYALRILYCCAFAGVFAASMTFISNQVPARRVAELLGVFGTTTYLGMIAGTQVGDLLLGSATVDRMYVDQMFRIAGLLALASIPFAWAATRGETPAHSGASPSAWQLVRRYHPGVLLVVGGVAAMVVGIPNAFLRPYAVGLGIPRIGFFFTVCAIGVIATRILARRWFERFGNRSVILLGMTIGVLNLLSFLLVHEEWHLVLPAVTLGCSQAMLFPAVTAAGSLAFPARYRGTGTILIVAASDIGILIGSPLAGIILNYSEANGLPAYPTMFVAMAGIMAMVGIWYALSSRKRVASIR